MDFWRVRITFLGTVASYLFFSHQERTVNETNWWIGFLHPFIFKISVSWDFPGGAVVKNLPANAGDMSSIPGP